MSLQCGLLVLSYKFESMSSSESDVHLITDVGDFFPSSVSEGNISDCSDDEQMTHTSLSETTEGNAVKSVEVESLFERHQFRRLSSKYLFATDTESSAVSYMSTATLDKLEDIIAEFPIPPSHVPQLDEEIPPIYTNLSSAAMKAVSFGFGSLRRGVDKLGIFNPKK